MSFPASSLANRTVVITGGFGILGLAAATVALASSARVALIDRGAAPATLDPAILAIPDTDLADFEAAQAAFARIVERFGTVDVLLNIAGAFEWRPVAESDSDLWLRLYRANVLTAVNASRAALATLRPGAAIVNVAAAAARRGGNGMAAYTAAKSGVLRLTESLAEELRPAGVRVNSVSPTIIDTPRNRADMSDADFSAWVEPEALAQTMLSLASGETTVVSGADVLVGAPTSG
ncbi:NAD-dependent oxidoreductase [Pseudoxanthomonas yeongjuensis]|uniref:SDR family NAD(P)-dependent oxidoreductase n=1 Tax=Pseudoxanthomonas yeongjuensis TaxID=377616 RepID=UPI0013907023|nr:SDR family NAD(P)-dependent oxidoreductase [Pseudoxanthomonas yeongjuensis]KAF1714599.1 NAD-dependent oxidoreductase [Pseudoxanthomonas yeongjuensis]